VVRLDSNAASASVSKRAIAPSSADGLIAGTGQR
jgi:hypothetical protein